MTVYRRQAGAGLLIARYAMTDHPSRSQRLNLGFAPALAAIALLAFASAPADAQAYRITLKNGNTFVAKYEPEQASFDSTKMIIFTDVGNRIALSQDDIEEVTIDIENRGFGKMIDNTTIVVGYSANDAPGGEIGEDGEPVADGTLMQVPTPMSYQPTLFGASYPAPGFPEGGFSQGGGGPVMAEPGNFSAGIPLSFVAGGYSPVPIQP
jgi:hypothetical protein